MRAAKKLPKQTRRDMRLEGALLQITRMQEQIALERRVHDKEMQETRERIGRLEQEKIDWRRAQTGLMQVIFQLSDALAHVVESERGKRGRDL
jgi:hypothetical protein